MRVVAQTEYGAFAVDLESEEIEPTDALPAREALTLNLPRGPEHIDQRRACVATLRGTAPRARWAVRA